MTVTGTIHTPIITIPGIMILGTMIPGIMIPGTITHGIMTVTTTDHTTIPHIITIRITVMPYMYRVTTGWITLRATARSTAAVGIVT